MSLAMLISLMGSPALAQDAPEPERQESAADARSAVVATMVVKVTRRDEAADALVAQAEAMGGYFAERSDQRLRLKVPAAQARDYLAQVEEQGVVVDSTFNTTGLSQQLADNQARLDTREEILARYFVVLETAGSDSVVTVEREIVNLVAEIERYKGTIRALEHRATYADITLDFEFRDRAAPSRGGSSSFDWLNTLNLADLIEDFHYGMSSRAAKRSSGHSAPDGFAPYRVRREFRAVSPDDVLYRARAEKHKPEADLDFWEEAVRGRMAEAGYREVSQERLDIEGLPGVLLEFTAPHGTDDYTYLVGFVPSGSTITVIEAAGEVSRFEARRAEVRAAFTAEAAVAK